MLTKIKEFFNFSNILSSPNLFILSLFFTVLIMVSKQRVIFVLDYFHIFSMSPVVWLNTHTGILLEIFLLYTFFVLFILILFFITLPCATYSDILKNFLKTNCAACFYIFLYTELFYLLGLWDICLKDLLSILFEQVSLPFAFVLSGLFQSSAFFYVFYIIIVFTTETKESLGKILHKRTHF